MVLKDGFGRPLLNLRVSVTQYCNLSCLYCHREGEEKHSGNPAVEMTVDEIVRIVRIAVNLGMTKVKLTGGEPLIRKDILEIVKGIAKQQGLRDLSMTTNGSLLAPLAKKLYKNGLMRVNVNIPTLDPETYRRLTGGELQDVIQGIEMAVKAGLYPVKLNMLVLRGENEKDIPKMMSFAERIGAILQLIELEPINLDTHYYAKYHTKLDHWEATLEKQAIRIETRKNMQNRHIYHLPNLNVEVIHPIENTEFCARCTRMRVTSDGKLKPCLMRNDNLVDILTPMRNGISDKQIAELFKEANRRRQPHYALMKNQKITY